MSQMAAEPREASGRPRFDDNALPHPASQAPRVVSEELLRGSRFVEILHQGELYRLQATRLGKLILTK